MGNEITGGREMINDIIIHSSLRLIALNIFHPLRSTNYILLEKFINELL